MKSEFPEFPKKFDAPDYQVPADYFPNLAQRLKAIPEQNPPQKKSVVRWIWMPAAAAALLVLIWFNSPNTTREHPDWPAEEVVFLMNELQLSTLYLAEDYEEMDLPETWEPADWEQDYLEWQELLTQQETEF